MSNYNLSVLSGQNSTLGYMQGVNTITGDAFFLMAVVVIFLIAFTAMSRFDTQTSFLSASFITTVSSVFLWALGLVSEAVLITVFTLLLISVFMKSQSR